MESIPGFVLVPRPVGSPRPAGAFFSAEVVGPAGPGAWQVRVEGRLVVLRTDLPLVPGQTLRLRSVGTDQGIRLFQLAEDPPASAPSGPAGPIVRALGAAQQSLDLWKGRLAGTQSDAWAADLAARGAGPSDPLTSALVPWLGWEAALEQGRSEPPPEDSDFWDLWNGRQPRTGAPWVAFPVRWDHEGTADAGLLRARWRPERRAFDRWTLTAAPAGVGFRLEADAPPGGLKLTWRFFDPAHRRAFETLARGWDRMLSEPGCLVTLEIAGARSVDVQA